MTDVNVQEQLTRKLAIKNNTDPFGNEWALEVDKGTALYSVVKIVKDEPVRPASYPNESGLDSKFTKPIIGQAAIEKYLYQAWDYNDKQVLEAAGKERTQEIRAEVAVTAARQRADDDGMAQQTSV